MLDTGTSKFVLSASFYFNKNQIFHRTAFTKQLNKMVNNRLLLRSKGNTDPEVYLTNQDKQNLFRVKHSYPIKISAIISIFE